MAARPRLRLLHTSDVHLGAYDADAPASRERLHDSFRQVIDIGLRERVDFMLIAGDFFDNARVSEDTLRYAGEQIGRLERPTVIAPGNHDHVGPGSVYDRYDLERAAPGLRIIRDGNGGSVTVDGLPVEIWARAHTDQDFLPFDDMPPRGEAPWQLAAGHGHYLHSRAALYHSFHIREEHLEASDRDYVALGHWEQLMRVAAGPRTVAAYSGAPLGHSPDVSGCVLIVDLMEDGAVRLTAHALQEGAPIAHDDLPYRAGVPPAAG